MHSIFEWLKSCSNKVEVGEYKSGNNTYVFYINPEIPFSIFVSIRDKFNQCHILI